MVILGTAALCFRLIGLGLLINLLIVGMISLVTLDAVHEVARNDLGKQLGTLDRQASAALTRPAATAWFAGESR